MGFSLTSGEVAELLGVRVHTLANWRQQGMAFGRPIHKQTLHSELDVVSLALMQWLHKERRRQLVDAHRMAILLAPAVSHRLGSSIEVAPDPVTRRHQLGAHFIVISARGQLLHTDSLSEAADLNEGELAVFDMECLVRELDWVHSVYLRAREIAGHG